MIIRSPVLFLVFNRPDTTAQVFEAIRRVRPPRLYVAADGPRPQRPGEAERCEQVRAIATAVDWPCEVKTLFREQNLGCKQAVSSGIEWFFREEPEGIILEDDCLPEESFFTYCDDLLQKHRDDPRVMCVSGVNFIAGAWSPAESYYFSRYSHIWGWASWRRAWQHYDANLEDVKAGRARAVLHKLFADSPAEMQHWLRVLESVASGGIDTWDYQWMYACWKQGGLSALPQVNLISNIGFGNGATHTTSTESKMANLPTGCLDLPLNHPASVARSTAADEWTARHVFEILPAMPRLKRAIAKRVGRLLTAIGI